MPENNDPREEKEIRPDEEERSVTKRDRRRITSRHVTFAGAILAIAIVLFVIIGVVSYRYGVFDPYVKEQFTAKMADIGIVFDAEVFRTTISPLELELHNATFKNKVTGELLFSVRDAHIGLTVQDLYAWQLNRNITVDSTDKVVTLSGAVPTAAARANAVKIANEVEGVKRVIDKLTVADKTP